eukprot:g2383.t1
MAHKTESVFTPADWPADGTDEEKQVYAQKLYEGVAQVKAALCSASPEQRDSKKGRTEVIKKHIILFTDIGDDIDDFAALALLLNTPDKVAKLEHVVTCGHGHHSTRAGIVQKLLKRAGNDSIPIGLGAISTSRCPLRQAGWITQEDGAENDRFAQVHASLSSEQALTEEDQMSAWMNSDACARINDTVERLSQDPECKDHAIVFLSIGPLHEVAAFLQQYPGACGKVHFVGMQGSIDVGYYGRPGCVRENNVKIGIGAAKQVLGSKAFLSKRLATLDTCGVVQLDQADYFSKVASSKHSVTQAYIENIQIWHKLFVQSRPWLSTLYSWPERSSILFDTVAAMIALEEPPQPSATEIDSPYLTFKKMHLHVTDSAHTIDANKFQKDPTAYVRRMVGAEFSEDDIAPCMTQIQTASSESTEAQFVYVTTGFRDYTGYLAAVADRMAGGGLG